MLNKNASIDGLQTRSEKERAKLVSGKGHFSSGYFSHESSSRDPLINRMGRKNISSTTERVVYKKAPKTPEKKVKIAKTTNISTKISAASRSKSDSFTRTPTRLVEASRPRSYARDILGIEDDELSLDSDDIARARKKAKEERRKNKKHKKSFIRRHKIFSFLVVPLFALILVVYFWGDSILLKITNGQSGLWDFIRSVVTGGSELRVGPDGRTNFLIFGTSGYDMAGTEADGVHDGAQLTDSIMVVSIDQKSKDIAMISLPRDLKTNTCTATGKINELYYCNNKDGKDDKKGANALKDRVQDILGIEIQYYVHLNWTSLIQVVNALDGITVTIDENINDDWTKTYIKAGVPVTLNGEQALGLARARHGTENGDFTRGASQQKILIAIKDKISNKNFGIPDLVNFANILGDNLRTDLTSDNIYSGAKLFTETNFDSIRQVPLIGKDSRYFATGYISGISYVYPTAGDGNYSDIKGYIKNMLTTNPIILENAGITILNGSGVEGLAEKEKSELEKSSFRVVNVGNAPSGNYFEKIYLYDLGGKNATRERLETYYNTKAISKDLLPNGISTSGVDFVVILGVGYSAD